MSLNSITNNVIAGLIVVALSVLIGVLSDSTTVQVIAYLIAAAMLAVVVLLLKRQRTNDAKAAVEALHVGPQPSTFDEKAILLLEAINDLAGDNPGTIVFTDHAAQKAGITTVEELDPIVKYLKDERLVDNMKIVHNTHLKITPAGIRLVQQRKGPPPKLG